MSPSRSVGQFQCQINKKKNLTKTAWNNTYFKWDYDLTIYLGYNFSDSKSSSRSEDKFESQTGKKYFFHIE